MTFEKSASPLFSGTCHTELTVGGSAGLGRFKAPLSASEVEPRPATEAGSPPPGPVT